MGIDISEQQLSHARALAMADAATCLVQGDAEHLPFQTQSLDVVFCDHGAMTFARPERTVAEVSRTLKPGGLFAFCMSSPIRDVCWDAETDRVSARLRADYFDLSALEDDECVCYQLPYGAWIRLFRQHSLLVEHLVELRAPEHPRTTYSLCTGGVGSEVAGRAHLEAQEDRPRSRAGPGSWRRLTSRAGRGSWA